ncbi:hypothetical protein [Hyphomicrobium sulfonivorans]|uniref:Uncharacterized protein n=1 Tax=Hyphomicrobium sulfonivorans TaxID=121290 RepID=A0A109BEK7_HYPSL|nr:hypothetical protein [Hyphomicrobium sulfonivorans]KWT67398.1 hypothetical protein APY04_1963 [Hyphomicrobium sulfonivorans]MBI1648717.1 hypothetical protein [Hyphomicrobium sulfonivorans]NSL70748.1 hypothetical protein [Hyphomicrobium sulfonivorans]
MSTETPAQVHGLSVAEKVSRLTAFITDDLDARDALGMREAGDCYLLIARSPESPIAQALLSHAERLSVMGVSVRAIFSEMEPANGQQVTTIFNTSAECRVIRDSRLLAAHEQLVLTPTRSWVGDSMRRDPHKRDALERYAADCAETAAFARRSFENLWRATTPVVAMPSLASLTQMPQLAENAAPDMRRQ